MTLAWNAEHVYLVQGSDIPAVAKDSKSADVKVVAACFESALIVRLHGKYRRTVRDAWGKIVFELETPIDEYWRLLKQSSGDFQSLPDCHRDWFYYDPLYCCDLEGDVDLELEARVSCEYVGKKKLPAFLFPVAGNYNNVRTNRLRVSVTGTQGEDANYDENGNRLPPSGHGYQLGPALRTAWQNGLGLGSGFTVTMKWKPRPSHCAGKEGRQGNPTTPGDQTLEKIRSRGPGTTTPRDEVPAEVPPDPDSQSSAPVVEVKDHGQSVGGPEANERSLAPVSASVAAERALLPMSATIERSVEPVHANALEVQQATEIEGGPANLTDL